MFETQAQKNYPKLIIISLLFLLFPNCSTLYGSKLTYESPLIVDDNYVKLHGNSVKGNFQGTVDRPAITISTFEPIIITDSNVKGPGNLIVCNPGNITISHTNGYSCLPLQEGSFKGSFLKVENAFHVVVQNCYIYGARYGISIENYSGDHSSHQTVRILNNQFYNIDGRPSNGRGGCAKSGDFQAHAIFLKNIHHLSNCVIAWNEMINEPYKSNVNDIISISSSSGTSNSHLLICNNYLEGALPAHPGKDSYAGGGIICSGNEGDTAETATAFVDIYDNQIVRTQNYGVAIAAGHDNAAYHNRVLSAGVLPSGALLRGGLGAYHSNYLKQPSWVFYNNKVYDNYLGVVRYDKNNIPTRSDHWLPGQDTLSLRNDVILPLDSSRPNLADEENEFLLWKEKLSLHNIHIGP